MFWSWLKQQNGDNLIGLDISSDFVKLLKINSTVTPFVVENFLISALPSDAIVKDEIKNPDVIAEVIKGIYKESGLTTNNVAFSIPRAAVIIKNFKVNARLTLNEIESRAWIEAQRYFPDLVGLIYLDFMVMGPSPEGSDLDVMLVACRKEQIDPYLEIAKLAGLKAKVVEVNSYALERALTALNPSPQQTQGLLNLDLSLSTLIIVQNNKLIFAHDQSFDGRRLMAQVQELTNNNEEVLPQVYRDLLKEKLSAHLRHTMHFFYSSRPNMNVERIVLSGDCAKIPELAFFIQSEIGIEAIIANPFNDLTLGTDVNIKLLQDYSPALMLCAGLSLASFESKRAHV